MNGKMGIIIIAAVCFNFILAGQVYGRCVSNQVDGMVFTNCNGAAPLKMEGVSFKEAFEAPSKLPHSRAKENARVKKIGQEEKKQGGKFKGGNRGMPAK